MALEPRLQLRPTQRLVMTAMLQQAIKLLPLSRLELIQTVQQEITENPLLEEAATEEGPEVGDGEMPEAREVEAPATDERGEVEIDWSNLVHDDWGAGLPPPEETERPNYEATLHSATTLADHLEWQLGASPLSPEERRAARFILGNLDEGGYFRLPLEEVVAQCQVSPEVAERALAQVQAFDPSGVAARDLRECLLLQLKGLGHEEDLVWRLVAEHLEELEDRNLPRLARKLGGTLEEVVMAARLIRSLDPRPGSRFEEQRVEIITPDVVVYKAGDGYEVTLDDEGIPPLRVNPTYRSILLSKSWSGTQEREYLEERMRSALWFIKSIEQRRQTILKVARSIVRFQRDFLDHGVSHLRPLVLRDVAEDIGMHESTVSRVTTRKYMDTPQGIYPMKFFFHSGLELAGGESASSVTVKEAIRKLVEGEDPRKPWTDQRIVERLRERNVLIARRTVTKYRKELRIPPASRRRRLFEA
ncbi:MAG: RNA polymerase factor sigma-54 [Nitrospinota bacterium]